MEFGTSGMLNEGTTIASSRLLLSGCNLQRESDGIHIDMDRLKKGEVKYVPIERRFAASC
jgi:hypothetical protein